MTASGKLFAAGSRYAAAFPLDSTTGLIANTTGVAATATYGLTWNGFKGFSGSFPTPRKISHYGQDRVLQIDWLPPIDGMDASVTVSSTEYDLIAALTGVKVQTLGTSKMIQVYSNKQGFEPSVALFFYQQAEDLDTGIRRWQSYLFASAKCVFTPASMTDTTSDLTFPVVPAISKNTIFGTALTEASNGTLTSQMGMLMTENKPHICAWKADGVATSFLFDADKPAANATTAYLTVTVDGVVTAPTTTPTTGPTFSPALVSGKTIICCYEGA